MLRRIPPALVLFIIAPVFGEMFSGSSPLNEFVNPVTFITLALLYGCGAIIARELVVRWRQGWFSLLLLGLAYGIHEEGLLVQSFFDPAWMDLGPLATYGRVAGVNWVWTVHLTIFHALISIAASVAFVEILYPDRRAVSWVKHKGWWILNWLGFSGVYLLWEIATTYDPGVWKVLTVLAILFLVLLARFIPAPWRPPRHRAVLRPLGFWLMGFLGLFVQFTLVSQGADHGAYPFPIALLLITLFDVFMLWMVLRWSGNGRAWDDRHRLALINGALSFFLIFGPLTVGRQYPIMYLSNPVFLGLLWWTARHVNRRVALEQKTATTV